MTRLELNKKLETHDIYFYEMTVEREHGYIKYVYDDNMGYTLFEITICKTCVEIETTDCATFTPAVLRIIADLAELIAEEDRINYSEVLDNEGDDR